MDEVVKEAPLNLHTYLNDLKARGSSRREPIDTGGISSEKGRQIMKMAGITIVRDFTEEWRDFYYKHSEPSDPTGVVRFSEQLKQLNRFIHLSDENFPIERPEFLKHTRSRNQTQNRERSAKIMAEISHARHMVMQHDGARSFPLLELLHRLLVYRLWEESKEYKNWHEEPCFDIGYSLRILSDMEWDMLSIVDKGCESGVRNSIRESKRAFERILDSDSPYSLKKRLGQFHDDGEEKWIGHRDGGSAHSHILGIPILPKGGSAYDTLDPWRAFVGPTFVREDEDSHR
jgi:hypothetical protein